MMTKSLFKRQKEKMQWTRMISIHIVKVTMSTVNDDWYIATKYFTGYKEYLVI